MKRFLIPGLFAVAVSGVVQAASSTFYWPAVGYSGQWPPNIDATNFVNSGSFSVVVPPQGISGDQFDPFQTKNTLNYTNTGFMSSVPGFDFRYLPEPELPPIPGVSYDSRHMAANFVNRANGVNGGVIRCVGAATNSVIFGFGFGLNVAKMNVMASNIVNSGTIVMDNTEIVNGLFIDVNGNIVLGAQSLADTELKLVGDNVDLSYGTLAFTSAAGFSNSVFGISSRDYGVGTDTNADWNPGLDLTAGTAFSSFFQTVNGTIGLMFLDNSSAYSRTTPQGTNGAIVRAVYFQDLSGPNVSKDVYFGSSDVGRGFAHIGWSAPYLDPFTHTTVTNYLYLSDEYVDVTTNTAILNGVPINYTFSQRTTPIALAPEAPNPPVFNDATVTNLYSYLDAQLVASLAATNSLFGGSLTNLPERIKITATGTLDLNHSTIVGPDYLSLVCTNQFKGNVGGTITAPYSDISLGVTNGFLTISNLLPPLLPRWSGEIQAFTGRWSDNTTNVSGTVSNDNRVLIVRSQVFPTTTPVIQDLTLHATNTLTISDSLNVTRNLYIDATTLVITTNDFSTALSQVGGLNISNPNIFWSSSMPNLKNLINNGMINGANSMNFAGGMTTPYSDPNAAIPYETFINRGTVTNQGSFIVANAFLNDGIFQNNTGGSFVLRAGCATLTNGLISAPEGDVNITANSLVASNHSIQAGGTLSLSVASCMNDGYTLFNQFGHTSTTNAPTNGGVTNGNLWVTGGGFWLQTKPSTGDLLGTAVSSFTQQNWYSQWAGEDRGITPNGFINNAAVGRLILDGGNSGRFFFSAAGGTPKALYVDSIELEGNATNYDTAGNLSSVIIAPGMTIYYAKATLAGLPWSEKLNGRNNGRFLWVSNYAGIFSATNVFYSTDGLWHTFNQALVTATAEDSDHDGILNNLDSTPIPTSWVFDNTVVPVPCGCSGITTSSTGTGGIGSNTGSSLGGIDSASGDNVLPFPVQPSGVAVSNLFAEAKGDYSGLFYETNGVAPGRAGYFSATLNQKGRLVGVLKLGNAGYTLAGNFSDSGALSLNNLRAGKNPRLNVSLQLDLSGRQITGQVAPTDNSWTAALLADRAVEFARGKYTFVIPGTDGGGSETPEGDGFGSVSVVGRGGILWNAALPDGTSVGPQRSPRNSISSQGIFPIYFAPYRGAGLLIGWLQFTNTTEGDLEGQVIWIKPSGAAGKYFQSGFTNETGVVGSQYATPLTVSNTNMLVMGGGNLTGLVTNVFVINTRNLRAPKQGDNKFTLTISKPTGIFNGSVIEDGRNTSFKGVLLQKMGTGYGFFLGTNESGQVWFSPTP